MSSPSLPQPLKVPLLTGIRSKSGTRTKIYACPRDVPPEHAHCQTPFHFSTLTEQGLSKNIVQFIDNNDRSLVKELLRLDEYVDMIKAGIIDPIKVVRASLANAASVASLILTTEAVVTDIPEEKPAPSGGGMPGGMGGMPGAGGAPGGADDDMPDLDDLPDLD